MQPLAIVTIINDASSRVEIRPYSAIYESVGVTAARYQEWHSSYGYDSLGIGVDGAILAPSYPIFSKVVDMFVDPVDLSGRKQSYSFRSATALNCAREMKAHVRKSLRFATWQWRHSGASLPCGLVTHRGHSHPSPSRGVEWRCFPWLAARYSQLQQQRFG
jgi:hypothetical protein